MWNLLLSIYISISLYIYIILYKIYKINKYIEIYINIVYGKGSQEKDEELFGECNYSYPVIVQMDIT